MGNTDSLRNSYNQGINGLLIASSSVNSKFQGKKVQQKLDIVGKKACGGLSGIKSDISTIRNYHSANKSGDTKVLNSSSH